MASIEKRPSGYRVKYRDPLGRQHSRTFARRADANRFGREIEVDKDRAAGSTRATRICPWPAGPRRSCR